MIPRESSRFFPIHPCLDPLPMTVRRLQVFVRLILSPFHLFLRRLQVAQVVQLQADPAQPQNDARPHYCQNPVLPRFLVSATFSVITMESEPLLFAVDICNLSLELAQLAGIVRVLLARVTIAASLHHLIAPALV